ncbi:MAG: fibronectin type III domain-containing protein, partial [bacterium]
MKIFFKKLFGTTLIAAVLAIGFPVQAGIVSSLQDTMTNHTVSVASGHTFYFVSPSGLAAGQDIRLTFATGFDLSALAVPNDLDLASGDSANCSTAIYTEKVLAAVPAGAVWGTAIAGQAIIFTSGTDTLAVNRCVRIRIGASAYNSANNIINPGTIGSKLVTLSGSFGDSGNLAVAITNPGQVVLNVTINRDDSGGRNQGGGGENPPPPDTTPPAISNIQTTMITTTSASVGWVTDKLANSFVDYGKTLAYEAGTVSNANYVFSRTIPLVGLDSDTTYHLRVRSATQNSVFTLSSDQTFKTLVAPDTTPPVISGINVTNLSGTGATVGWTTDEASDSKIEYGLTEAYGGEESSAAGVTSHLLNLTGLASETTYHYKVTSRDSATNSASSADQTFTTLDNTPPIISNLAVSNLTSGSAVISWTTNELSTTKINFGPTEAYGETREDTTPVIEHTLTLTGLNPDTTYHFSVTSADTTNNSSSSLDRTATTPPDTTPPPNVSGLNAMPGNRQIVLGWTNPQNTSDFAGVMVRRKTGSSPQNQNDGLLAYQGIAQTLGDSNLTNNTRYYYAVFSYDQTGNFSSGALIDAIPRATAVCGDGSCMVGENAFTCPADCGGVAPICGDQTCNGAETNATCPGDCPLALQCGNNICEVTESATSCPQDCGGAAPPPITGGPVDQDFMKLNQIQFLGFGETLPLYPNSSRVLAVLRGTDLTIIIPDSALSGEVREATFALGNQVYRLGPRSSYVGVLTLPSQPGLVAATIRVDYASGNFDEEGLLVSVEDFGQVYELDAGFEVPVGQALVGLYVGSGAEKTLWPAANYNQTNPVETLSDGNFGFEVPAGTYSLKIEKSGYETLETQFGTSTGMINDSYELKKKIIIVTPPEPPAEQPAQTISEAWQEDVPVQEKIGNVAKAVATEAIEGVQETLQAVQDFTNNPEVQKQTENIVAPTVAAVAVANTAVVVTAGAFNAVAYLQYLFLQPLLLFGRRKRKAWGIVYDSLTKMPVDLVVVRLLDAATNRIVQSRVTDREGRYFFLANPGEYRIQVIKNGYLFPTSYLREAKEDVSYTELYHGEIIKVETDNVTISANVPLDPVGKPLVAAKTIKLKKFFRTFQRGLATFSIILAAAVVYIMPTVFTISLLALQIAFLILFRKLAVGKKPKGWGIVYDEGTKGPLGSVVVRIFEPKYNKLL